MKKLLLGLCALPVLCACHHNDTVITSPDGSIVVEFALSNEGRPSYNVTVDGDTLISPSALGMVAQQWNLAPYPTVTVSKTSLNEEWTQPWGENKTHRNSYNEMAVTLTDSTESTLTIRFRAFDNGYAFRYEWNAAALDSLTITDELTEFRLAGKGDSWAIPGNPISYEFKYNAVPIDSIQNANTPLTYRTDSGIYGSIHEAALYDFPDMRIVRSADGVLKADLVPLPNGVMAYTPAKFTTAWRTMQIGRKAVDLINSSLILNLNDPSKIEDTSWIKPQKYVGVWWGMHLGTQTWVTGPKHGATTENAIEHIDFAADNNLQGVLFEGWNLGWENWGGNQHFDYIKAQPDFNVDSIAAYARQKGIELWMHAETGGNIPEFEAVMDSAFAYYASLGVHTLKTGYAGGFKGGYNHHSQYGVRHYQKVVETAAKYHIMIDAHEPIKDTGIRRTWPNMMTREGARGQEWDAWSEGNDADYLTTLPYVRLLGGPMDYTPGIFDIYQNRARADKTRVQWNGDNSDKQTHTTIARQIANWVIIYSPLQMAADQIENYAGHEAFEFFRTFNADCDWSEALQGEIGQYIAVVRRAGDTFFYGAGTNTEPRTIEQPLDFLPDGVTYNATIYADKPGSDKLDSLEIRRITVTSSDKISVAMNASGGQAITFTPAR